VLVECGFVRAQTAEGVEFTFTPSLGRIAALGSPPEIVGLYADLHGPRAQASATYIMAILCDQDDPTPLIGWHDEALNLHAGAMPPVERVIIAKHLMQHGIIGKARPETKGDGEFSDSFHAAEYIAAARVHLGLSSADAEALSMTEFQTMLEMKFPAASDRRDIPTADEYDAAMARLKEIHRV
jgi:hypothetical protein